MGSDDRVAIAHLLLFAWSSLTAPDTFQVQFTPDDAYYYLGLARNFVRTGTWTFDSGVSITSGFHPLLADLLSLLTSRNYAINTVSIMEWTLALLAGVLYTLCFYRAIGHNYLFTGNPVQSSALMKAHWSQISGPAFQKTVHLLTDALVYSRNGDVQQWYTAMTYLVDFVPILAREKLRVRGGYSDAVNQRQGVRHGGPLWLLRNRP